MWNRVTLMILILGVLFLSACSNTRDNIVTPGDDFAGLGTQMPPQGEKDASISERCIWGYYNLVFDPETLTVTAVLNREATAHANVTPYVTPPACNDCVKIKVNSFDTVTRILDADITLRNPTLMSGYDVRGILYTNDYGHELLNADDWTGLWDVPGGDTINPFKAFAKDQPNRMFGAGSEYMEKYLIYIPLPPHYDKITYAVDASWPGNCKEPYTITNFWQEVIYDVQGSIGNIYVDVCDWQNDVSGVTLAAPEITGEPFTQLSNFGGNTWYKLLSNNATAGSGFYKARITATSVGSGPLTLSDYITITVTKAKAPVVLSMKPSEAMVGSNLKGVTISGTDFEGPAAEVKLENSGEPDIVATNVVVVSSSSITCDIDIPLNAATGKYDVEVKNGTGKSGTGSELFTVLEIPKGWARTWGGYPGDHGASVATDNLGNVYVAGVFGETVDFDPGEGSDIHASNGGSDAFLSKYDSSGNFQWARTWGGTDDDGGLGVDVDDTGNVYVSGYYRWTVDFDPGEGVDEHTVGGT